MCSATCYRTDRDSRQTGKERGGGVCLYVSEKFCDRANIELLKEKRYRTVKGKARLLKTFIPRSLHLLNS